MPLFLSCIQLCGYCPQPVAICHFRGRPRGCPFFKLHTALRLLSTASGGLSFSRLPREAEGKCLQASVPSQRISKCTEKPLKAWGQNPKLAIAQTVGFCPHNAVFCALRNSICSSTGAFRHFPSASLTLSLTKTFMPRLAGQRRRGKSGLSQ